MLTNEFNSYIHQSYTWSRFEITQDLFNKLMSYVDVYPTFLDIVQLFGEKSGPVEESFTLFFNNLTPSPDPDLQGNQRCGFGSYNRLLPNRI